MSHPAPRKLRQLPQLHLALLKWFDQHQRPLPWRQDRNPYRIWVSEVMLQQTTVAAVGPYFERFLKRFPNLQTLAEATQEDVLKLWEGLGYYRRARHLHDAAKTLWQNHGENWPTDAETWKSLPGIGPYMLGAILSQAFDVRLPIVEANTLRVLSRWFAFEDDPREGSGKKWVWQAAETVLPEKRCGDFNQAMMELGSQVCKIEQPNCTECPVQAWCQAFKLNKQDRIPVPPKPKQLEEVQEVCLVIRQGSLVLVVKRKPEVKRWANLWEFPHIEQRGRADETALNLAKSLGLQIELVGEFSTIQHTVTRFQITLHCWEANWQSGELMSEDYAELKWVEVPELAELPTSSPQRKLWKELARRGQQLRLF